MGQRDVKLKKYFENMPFGKDTPDCAIWGKKNQETINNTVKELHDMSMKAGEEGDKEVEASTKNGIYYIEKQCADLRTDTEEAIMLMGGGDKGKSMVSNWTPMPWIEEFFGGNGSIDFDEDLKMILDVPSLVQPLKRREDIFEDLVVKGEEEANYMKAHQELVSEKSPDPSFDIDYFVSNLLKSGWKSFLTDEVGGIFFLQEYLKKNVDTNGDIADQLSKINLDKWSFDPDIDTRLHEFYSDRLRKAHDPESLTPKEEARANQIIAREQIKS